MYRLLTIPFYAILILLLPCPTIQSFAQTYAIGHITKTFTDASRASRSVPVEIYYPASSAGTGTPVAGTTDKFPVVSFGHGAGLTADLYEYLADTLAKHGIITVLPTTETSSSPDFTAFALDLKFALQSLKNEGTLSSSIFYNRVDTKGAIGGHSMGGGCSIKATAGDTTITCLFNLAAAAIFSASTASSIKIPALMFGGSKDCACPPSSNQLPFYTSLKSTCKALVILTDADHCQFAAASTSCQAIEASCGVSPAITEPQQQGRTIGYLLPFLQWQLFSDNAKKDAYLAMLASAADASVQQSCAVTGILNEATNSLGFSINPNVGRSFILKYNTPISCNFHVTICNAVGLSVSEWDEHVSAINTETTFAMEHLPTGCYFITARCGDYKKTERIFVQ